jgi:hypothetical protein
MQKLFCQLGRSTKWERLNEEVEKLVKKWRDSYLASQCEKLTGVDSSKQFYKTVRNFILAERPSQCDVKDLFPGLTDKKAAEELATLINRMSREFQPLDTTYILVTTD